MRLALCQMKMTDKVEENYNKSIEMFKEAAKKSVDLILIPTANTKSEPLEMFEWEVRMQAFQKA